MENFKPKKPEKDVISIRIDHDTLIHIDEIANGNNMSRNELINQCIEFALSNLESK